MYKFCAYDDANAFELSASATASLEFLLECR